MSEGTTSNREMWASRVRGWAESGLSARAYGAREGFDGKRLSWWRSYLGGAAQQRRKSAAPIAMGAMVPVRAVSKDKPVLSETPIEIAAGVLRIRAGFSEEALRQVLGILAR